MVATNWVLNICVWHLYRDNPIHIPATASHIPATASHISHSILCHCILHHCIRHQPQPPASATSHSHCILHQPQHPILHPSHYCYNYAAGCTCVHLCKACICFHAICMLLWCSFLYVLCNTYVCFQFHMFFVCFLIPISHLFSFSYFILFCMFSFSNFICFVLFFQFHTFFLFLISYYFVCFLFPISYFFVCFLFPISCVFIHFLFWFLMLFIRFSTSYVFSYSYSVLFQM